MNKVNESADKGLVTALAELEKHISPEELDRLSSIVNGSPSPESNVGPRAVELAQANGEARRGEATPDLLDLSAADEGNAQAFLIMHQDEYLHVNQIGWLYHNGKHWENEGADERLTLDILATLTERRVQAVRAENQAIVVSSRQSAHNVNACKTLLLAYLYASIGEFDNNPDLLNCDNGVVNLRTGELVQHNRGQRFTYCIGTPYDKTADCLEWEKWLHSTITPEGADDDGRYIELSEWIRRAVGYSLTGHTHEQCLFYIQGPPRAGKGLMLQVLNDMLSYPISSFVDFDTFVQKRGADNQNFDLAGLKSCRMLTASESEEQWMLNAKRVKSITGNDPVRCAHKGKKFFTYTPTYKIWLGSNFKVKAPADDAGLWSRIRVIVFPNSYEGREDHGLKERLEKNLTGVLKWAIDGAMQWYIGKERNDGLGRPAIIMDAVREHRDECDTLREFIEECGIKGDANYTKGAIFTSTYRLWCTENGHPALGGRRLSDALKQKGYVYKTKRIGDKTAKCWIGIGLAV